MLKDRGQTLRLPLVIGGTLRHTVAAEVTAGSDADGQS